MKFKRALACAAAVSVMSLGTAANLPAPAMYVSASSSSVSSSGGFTYEQYYSGDNTITITGCDEGMTEVVIPEQLDGMTVVTISSQAFRGNTEIVSVELPDTVTYIPSNAFRGCTSLERVKLPAGISYISSYSFTECSSLKEVAIPDGIGSIGEAAFWKCSSLTEIRLPESLTDLDDAAFMACSSLERIELPSKLTVLPSMLFYGCSKLDGVVIPDGVVSIDSSAFRDCTSLTEITIPDETELIEYYAFMGCTALEKVTLGKELCRLGERAFDGCTSLRGITFPPKMTSVGVNVFSGCSSLEEFSAEGEIRDIAEGAFSGTALAANTPAYAAGWLISYDTSAESVVVEEGTVGIANRALYQSSAVSVKLPDSLKYISDCAFSGSEALTDCVLPDGIKRIGKDAFDSTPLLTEQTGDNKYIGTILVSAGNTGAEPEFMDGITGIADGAFYNNAELERVNIPDTVKFVGSTAFRGCSSLREVHLPAGLDTINSYTFASCSSLTDVVIPDSVRIIGDFAFVDCGDLDISFLPDGVEEIGYMAFCGNISSSMYVPESVQIIGEGSIGTSLSSSGMPVNRSGFLILGESGSFAEKYAAKHNRNFTAVQDLHGSAGSLVRWSYEPVSKKLSFIGEGEMFSYSSSAQAPWSVLSNTAVSVTFSDDITNIGDYAFLQFSKLTEADLPANCTSIGKNAFANCSSLEKAELPEGLITVGSQAFSRSRISALDIPVTMSSGAAEAFSGMEYLRAVNAADGSKYYSSADGVLFSADGTELIMMPRAKFMDKYTVPANVTKIGDQAFSYSSIPEVILPDGLEGIGKYAFSSSAIGSMNVPETVTAVGSCAFQSCNSLERIFFSARDASYDRNIFYGNYNRSAPIDVYAYISEGSWSSISASGIVLHDLADYDGIEGIVLSAESISLGAGTDEALTASADPRTVPEIVWRSSDTSVANVSCNGNITAFGAGKCKVTASSPDGKYSASCTVTVTGDAEPSKGVTELPEEAAGFLSENDSCWQIPCESRGGFYLADNSRLTFMSLYTGSSETVCTFNSGVDSFIQGDKLYRLSESSGKSTVTVFDLTEQRTSGKIFAEGINASAVGADSKGRIYLGGTDTSTGKNIIMLLSADGTLLSKTAAPSSVLNFDAFDPSNGNFYYETNDNWRYWGYDHYVRKLLAGRVTDNDIAVSKDDIYHDMNTGMLPAYTMMLYQIGFGNHSRCAEMIDDRYLAIYSTFYGTELIVDSNAFDPLSESQMKTAASVALSGSDNAGNTLGVLTFGNGSSYLTAASGDSLGEYDIESGKLQAECSLSAPVFSLARYDGMAAVFEKTDTGSQLELIEWKLPDSLTIEGAASISQGEAQRLTVSYDSPLDLSFEWSSSDSSVVSVDRSGNITGFRPGTAEITASASNGISSVFTVTVTARENTSGEPSSFPATGSSSSNIGANDYSTYASVVNSYLNERPDGTIERIEHIGDKVVIERYSHDAQTMLSNTSLSLPLKLFGGCFTGGEYNFIVCGQENLDETDSTEVMRVMKYSKDWELLDSASVYGANTYIPFDAGSLRMTETSGRLYIHTCHEMYNEGDGLHHQANMTFVFDEETLEQKDAYYDVMNLEQAGYVSHSFNQFIRTDGTYIYRLDQGDANPRGIAVTRCLADGDITQVSYIIPMRFSGGYGNNSTGAAIGGFELSSDNYLIACSSVDHDSENSSLYGNRNILLLVTAQDYSSNEAKWVTSYTEDDGISTSNPQLIKLGEQAFLLMWEESSGSSAAVKAVTLNGDGEFTSDIHTLSARLSDCQPIADSCGNVRWYVTNGGSPVFYSVDPYNIGSFTEAGSGITWSVENGVLTIGGTGVMSVTEQPWAEYAQSVTKVVIEDGVTSVADGAFRNFRSLTSAEIADSVKLVGSGAFDGCTKLASISLPEGLNSINGDTFNYCTSLRSVYIPASAKTVGMFAFNGCTSLTDVYYGGTAEEWAAVDINKYGNDALTSATLHAPSDGIQETSGTTTTTTTTTSTTTTTTTTTSTTTTTTSTTSTTTSTTTTTTSSTTSTTTTIDIRTLTPEMVGDMDRSNTVTAVDASLILKLYAELSSGDSSASEAQLYIADVNRNGKIEATDASVCLTYYADVADGYSERFIVYIRDMFGSEKYKSPEV